MKIEDQVFYGESIDVVDRDYEDWKTQFAECFEYWEKGYAFLIVRDQTIHRIVLYVVNVYFFNGHMYIKELSVLESFKNIEEAYALCNGIIDGYINNTTCIDSELR